MSRSTVSRKKALAVLCGLSAILGGWQAAQAATEPQREPPPQEKPSSSTFVEGSNRIPACH
ncbi:MULTISPECIES: hypothetical protein [unclassified Brenneria]|uniref:hypothetical protein n=1 Tax=unclassified Brenneria TaxID=2634434 RepID=UPI0029C4E507|nr:MULTISPECIES: hypothetical protein [unclassified Brenneria]MDX5627227.1 hypothetical protein [Brenneria sp. L3-3Z]MDX5694617.1 hypothetical protein [Brenneria sp. L4-2C]MEE3661770.1 hypothetical protein [Brenneria sp. g21c3]